MRAIVYSEKGPSSVLTLVERPFSVTEAKAAREAFLTSASNFLIPIVQIDESTIGDGRPGPVTRALVDAYAAHASTDGAAR